MLYIKEQIVRDFSSYAISLIPNEACGMLVSFNDSKIIDTFIPIPNNSTNTKYEFNLEPSSFIPMLYKIDKLGGNWVGLIHSHPNSPAYPSRADIDNWHYPDLSYWIYSFKEKNLRAYYIIDKIVVPQGFYTVSKS